MTSTNVIPLLTEACKHKIIPNASEDDNLSFTKVVEYDLKGNERMICKVSLRPHGTIDRAYTYSVGWVMDNESAACMRCNKPFGPLTRKHHCRICGYLICNECCSSNRLKIPALSSCEKASRVCNTICSKLLPEEIAQLTSYEMGSFKSPTRLNVDAPKECVSSKSEDDMEDAKAVPESPVKSGLLNDTEELQRAELEIELAEEMSHIRSRLERGMLVIKHGRSGEPKRRLLKCDHDVTKFFFINANTAASAKSNTSNASLPPSSDPNKVIHIADILSVRLGTDLDPEGNRPRRVTTVGRETTRSMDSLVDQGRVVSTEGEATSTSDSTGAAVGAGAGAKNGGSKGVGFLRGALFGRDADDDVYGTAILRRRLTSTDKLATCLSIITEHRTFDIECLQGGDFDFLAWHLSRLHQLSSKIRDF